MLLNPKKSLKCFTKMAKSELVDARPSNSQKYRLKIAKLDGSCLQLPDTTVRACSNITRPPCAPSFVKSRMLCPLQTDFSFFQQIFFILVCIHAGNPRLPPRVLASGPKPCGAKNIDDAGRLIMRSNEKKNGLTSRNR